MPTHLLRNPQSGRGKRSAGAESLLRRFGPMVDLTGPTADESHRALTRAVAAGEVEHLVVAGGDGLINIAIQPLATTDIELSIVPVGTGNDFAAALGITGERPLDERARPTDLLRLTETASGVQRWVASIAIAGFPAAINARANTMRLPLGSQVYTAAALFELPRFRRLQLSFRIDGEDFTTDSAMLALGNTCYFGGGMLACPDARPDDGLVHLTSIDGVGRFQLLRHLQGRAGGTASRPEVRRLTARTIELTTAGVDVWGDGEFIATSPLTVEAVPDALQVRRDYSRA